MAEEPQGDIAPEKETQDVAAPTTEQQTTETSKEVAEDGLPTEASERTKTRFDELTSQLKEERQRREALESAFKTLKPEDTVQPTEPQMTSIYDPDTGLLNEQALNAAQQQAYEANQRATKAEQAVQEYFEDQKKRAEEAEKVEAFTSHPDLNPQDKTFDQNLSSVTSSILLRSMLHPEEFNGKQLSFKEAGDKAKELVQKIAAGAKQEGAKEAIEQLTPKEQAGLEATGSSTRREVGADLDSLKRRTRRGDDDALIERLKGVKS